MTALNTKNSLMITSVQTALTDTPEPGFVGVPVAKDDGLYYKQSDGTEVKLGPKEVYYFNAGSAGMNFNDTITATGTQVLVHRWTGALPATFKGGIWWAALQYSFQESLLGGIGRARLRYYGTATINWDALTHEGSNHTANERRTVDRMFRIPFSNPGAYNLEFRMFKQSGGTTTINSIQLVFWQIAL